MKKKSVELLAPAGGAAQLIAAVENGADAVYLGGRAFNARANAGNFEDETLRRAVDYAHRRGVLVFVTMNTLLAEEELAEALAYAEFLYEIGVDALIVQDLGFGAQVRRRMPALPLHLSTQATNCDVASTEAAARCGYDRIVAARELSLEEIRALCAADRCDVEVFVHGALCVCYSGQCQMSRHFGGRSGNRGSCAQPCRLPYASRFAEGMPKAESMTHPLSPRDLCLLDDIGALIDAGVCSFKIEGRMKSPEYVAVVTSLYRKYIDEYLEMGKLSVRQEDRQALLQIFNRGAFTDAYLHGRSGEEMMSGFIPKNQGVPIGRVAAVRKGSTLIDVELEQTLAIGDGIELHGRAGGQTEGKATGNIITYYKELENGLVRIGDLKGVVRKGDLVYRTSSGAQLDGARRTYDGIELNEAGSRRGKRKRPIDMHLTVQDGILTLTAETVYEPGHVHWESLAPRAVTVQAGPFASAEERATPRERYANALSKTGDSPFALRRLVVDGELSCIVRAAELNALRREAFARLEEALRFRRTLPETASCAPAGTERRKETEEPFELFFHTLADWRRFSAIEEVRAAVQREVRVLLPLAELIEAGEEAPDGVLPYISHVSRGEENARIEARFEDCVALCRKTGLAVGSLGWLLRFAAEGIAVTADHGLNAYNSATVAVLKALGATEVRESLEAAEAVQGAYPLMVTEHRFEMTSLESRRGHEAEVLNRPFSSQSLLLPRVSGSPAQQAAACLAAGKNRLYFGRQ